MTRRLTPRITARLICTLVLLAAAGAQAQKPAKKKAPPPAPVPVVDPAPASDEQIAATALTYFGAYVCDFKQTLNVSRHPRVDGYVELSFDKQMYTLKPVLSATGALRLEDVRGRLLLLQIPVKSMLLDGQTGRRLADACMHETQIEYQRSQALTPAQAGLNIDPARAAEAAAAASATAASAAAQPASEASPAAASAPTTK